MLVIKPKYLTHEGEGIAEIISKIANSGVVKKVAASSVAKKVLNQATKKNFQKAANSALGKTLKSAVISGVANATEKVADNTLKKLGVTSVDPKTVSSAVTSVADSALERLGVPPQKAKKRKKSTKPSISKRHKKTGTGIILE